MLSIRGRKGTGSRHGSPRESRGGFSLVDSLVAIVVLVFGVGGLSQAVVTALRLGEANEHGSAALDGMRQLAERMRGEPFDQLFALYNADPADDPGGPGTAPGSAFDVRGLDPVPGDADGRVGAVVLPVAPGPGSSLLLVEQADLPLLGMPRDLDGENGVDASDHADAYILLPVQLRTTWRDGAGVHVATLEVLLVE